MIGLDPSILQMQLTLRPELIVNRSETQQGPVCSIEDPVTGRLYEIGVPEFQLLQELESNKSIEAFLNLRFPEEQPASENLIQQNPLQLEASIAADGNDNPSENRNFDKAEVQQIISWALQKGLLKDAGEALSMYQRRNAVMAKVGHASKWLNWISFRIPLGCPESLFKAIAPKFTWVFSSWFFVLWSLVSLYASVQFYFHSRRFWDQTDQVISDGKWIQLLVVWAVVKVVHELAHGIAAHKYRSHIRGCGILFILFMPMAYVDITSSAKLKNPWHRIVISAAGMYIEIFMAAIALIVWATTKDVTVSQWAYALVISSGVSTVLFNANPLMKFDGYFILSDLLGKTNLAENGKSWVGSVSSRWIFGTPYTHHESAFGFVVGAYGIAAAIWRVLLNLTLLISATAIFYGLGIVIACGAVVAMYVVPYSLKLLQVLKQRTWTQWQLPNLIASSSIAAIGIFTIFKIFSGPATIDSPAVVRADSHSMVRCQSEGFLKDWKVSPGQKVKEGQVLAELTNPTLKSELQGLEIEVRKSEVQCRILLHENELGQLKIEQEELQKLQTELQHHQDRMAGLLVRAQCDGRVPDILLENQKGRYFKEGDTLLDLVKSEKEVAISISQDDLPSLSRQVGQPVQLIFAGFQKIDARLESIEPRASEKLLSDSLSSTNGGPLSVKMAEESRDSSFDQNRQQLILAVPRITATVKVSEELAHTLKLGQTGVVYFQSEKQSLGSYLYLGFRRWLQTKMDQAGI